MENAIHEETKNGLTIKIFQDDTPITPDESGDNSLFLVASHRQFCVKGPNGGYGVTSHWTFPLEAYIHSGVVLALASEGNFPDRAWDVSQLGAVYVSREYWKTRAKARTAALSLISEWNNYLSGNVYGYKIENAAGDEIESCWGYSGDYDNKNYGALSEARAIVDRLTHKGTTDEKGQYLMAFMTV